MNYKDSTARLYYRFNNREQNIMAEFNPVKGYEGSYIISKEGEVVSLEREVRIDHNQIMMVRRTVMSVKTSPSGEKTVLLSKNSLRTVCKVDDLIRSSF